MTRLMMVLVLLTTGHAQGQSDSVTISAAEFQRTVYEAHVVTKIVDKPELDASLQVLLELQRRNPQADPTALANVLRQALAHYRTNAPIYIRDSGLRDEVLASYLESFGTIPGRTNFASATMTLLQSLVIYSNTPYTGADEKTYLVNSGNQRLLTMQGTTTQREALVKECALRGAVNSAFGTAMDLLLGPEVGVLRAYTPAQILSLNSSLSNSPTLQYMLHCSNLSGDGTVTLTTEQLKDYFTREMSVMRQIVDTNLAVDLEILDTQTNLYAYITNSPLIAANTARENEVKLGQRERLAGANASAQVLAELVGSAQPSDLVAKMKTVATVLHDFGESVDALKVSGAMMKCVGAGGIVAAGLELATLCVDMGPTPEEMIMDEIKEVKEMINELSGNMNYRFDHVDQQLVQVLDQLDYSVQLIDGTARDVNKIRKDLLNVQSELYGLERALSTYLSDLFRQKLVGVINNGLDFEGTWKIPMGYNSGEYSYLNCAGEFYNWAAGTSPFCKNTATSPSGLLQDAALYAALKDRRECGLNYLNEFCTTRLKVPALSPVLLANPRDWFLAAHSYLQLALEQPQFFRFASLRVPGIITTGQEISDFCRNLTFTAGSTNINWPLYNALLGFYAEKQSNFVSQVQLREQRNAADHLDRFAVDSWRNWAATAPRRADVTSSVPYLPLSDQAITRIAAGSWHSLALRADGRVVAWGAGMSDTGEDFNYGQAMVPADATNVMAIAAGCVHSLALSTNGTVLAWGSNEHGQTTVPENATNITAIAAGYWHSLALRSDRTVVGWGFNWGGEINVPADLTNVMAIVAGAYHSMALRNDGTVVVWGSCDLGQTNLPAGLTNVTAIAAGDSHCLALRADGVVVGWGSNGSGQTNVPAGLSNIVQIAAGGNHSLAVQRDGTVVAWGDSTYGQTNAPLALRRAVAIAAGGTHSLAIQSDGTVFAWGRNEHQQCRPPGSLPGGAAAVSAGLAHSLVLQPDGTVVAWGDNHHAQSTVATGLNSVVAMAGGHFHSLALKSDGRVVAWGAYGSGQSDIPEDLQGVVAIDGGRAHSMALRADGRVVVWGDNEHGQRNVPARATNIVAIAAGWSHNLALRADGEVVAWGYNGDGAATVPAEAKNHVVAIDASLTSMALRDDGTVVTWGGDGLTRIPSTQNHDFAAIGLGTIHAVGLRRDGTVFTWGDNAHGQTNMPAGLSDVVAISAGNSHTLALKADGTVVAWGGEGDLNSGQSDVPAPLSRYERYVPPTKSSDLLVTSPAPSQFNGRLMNGVGWTTGAPVLGTAPGAALSFDGLDDYVHVANGVYFNTNFTIEAWIYPRAHSIWARVLDFSNTNTTSGINECVMLTFCDASGLRPHLRVGQKTITATNALRLNEWVHLSATLNGTNATLYANGVAIGSGTVSQPLNVVRTNSKFGASNSPGEPNANFVLDELRIWNVALTPEQIAAGMTNRAVGTEPNLVASWGFDDWPRPSIAAMTSGAQQVAAGRDFNLATRRDGTVSAWGANNVGQCAIPSGLGVVTEIAAGSGHCLALKTNNNGSVVAWGWNGCGQANVPAPALHDVMAVAAGGAHSLALKRDGTVLAWGRNNAMQTNVPAGLDSVVAIAAGGQHSLALKADTTVVSWGWNGYGQTNTIGLGDVVAIAAGENHSVALLTNGCVVAWGRGDHGQTAVPLAARSGVVAISARKDHTLALKGDGTVVAWGDNTYGQTNLPAGLGNVVALAAGERHNLFLTAQPAGSNDLGMEFVLANVPSVITEEWLPAVYDDLVDSVSLLGTTELSGAKALIGAVLELGMPYTMERDDVLHGFFHGTEALPDQEVVTELFSSERDRLLNTPHARPMLLGEVLSPRFACFADRLNQRLLDLQATSQPEIPRLVDHTLRLLKLLRDAHAVTPPPAVEIGRQTSGLDVVLHSEPYARYALEYCTDLKVPAWSSVTTNLHNGERVTGPLPGDAQRWYRAVLPPRKMD